MCVYKVNLEPYTIVGFGVIVLVCVSHYSSQTVLGHILCFVNIATKAKDFCCLFYLIPHKIIFLFSGGEFGSHNNFPVLIRNYGRRVKTCEVICQTSNLNYSDQLKSTPVLKYFYYNMIMIVKF